MEKVFCMATGDRENSYATNSRVQEKAIMETSLVLRNAVERVYASLSPRDTMVVADLGCSSGPNTLLVVSQVMNAVRGFTRKKGDSSAVDVQFFLNDLPNNDFNLLFRSLGELHNLETEKATVLSPYYVAGLPGSFYTRLFPCQSVHIFHSSYCLHWRSKVPEGLSSGAILNEHNVYIGKASPPSVVKLFQEQFQEDFESFLALRYRELVYGGRMVLTFLGRKSKEMFMHGEVGNIFELLTEALQSLVQKGLVEKEKLISFNLPFYAPSVDEVKALIKENELFDIENIRLFESNWDPEDDSDRDMLPNSASSGNRVAKTIRAVTESLIMDHFGEAILDELFMTYASIVAKHLEKGKAKYTVVMVSLQKAMH
ncbi:unnamed protein product [Urochloa decumbens]|uniref:Uncharacterized protein n=1 Tax=Urochloa decumbens TaxID=240449 RepID=A0ABC9DFU2_9POAL